MTVRGRSFDHAFVVPAYGVSPYLAACLASIAAQTRSGSEVLVTTSTPAPEVFEIARQHRAAVRVNPHRGGIGSDWNFALQASGARFVTLAHQDDRYEPAYLERMSAALEAVDDALIGFCDYTEATAAGPRPLNVNLRVKRFLCDRAFRGRPAIRSPRDKRRLLAWGNPVCCPSVVIDRGRLGDFRFAENLASNLDWDAWLRMADLPGAFVRAPAALVVRTIHLQSETSALIADRRRLAEDRALFERVWPRPVATLVCTLYRASYRANRTEVPTPDGSAGSRG